MANIVDVRIKALERQIDILKSAIAQPRGIFETIDDMVKTFRMANRETLAALGISTGAVAAGQLGLVKKVEQLRIRSRQRIFRPPVIPHLGLIRR